MGSHRRKIGKKDETAQPRQEKSSIYDILERQETTISLSQDAAGGLMVEIVESTFQNAQLAVFALEAADNVIMRGIEGDTGKHIPKEPLAPGEPMSMKVVYYRKDETFDRVDIEYSTFTCDVLAIIALRLAMQFLNEQIARAMQGSIVLPGSGPGSGRA